jgi:hypothetical protein
MSPSEVTAAGELAGLAQRLAEAVSQAGAGDLAAVPEDVLRRLVSGTVRLYAARCEAASADIEPLDRDISTTEAVVMASALLKARDLNPFDLALWFSRTRAAG